MRKLTTKMYRTIYNDLLLWKNSPERKPLMLYGARQVGKTYILKKFGEKEYENLVYINCYLNDEIKILFESTKNVENLILGLSSIASSPILPKKTLIFLDEVQEVPQIVGALKYFCEDAPEINIAVAGSLLGVINLSNTSFPTGKVDILHLYPMTFIEFLDAIGEKQKLRLLYNSEAWEVVNSLNTTFADLLRKYYFVGGMPEAVISFKKYNDPEKVRTIHNNILAAYEADIAKHSGKDAIKARMIFQSIPAQLAKENRKFLFGALKKGARASDYEYAIQWLADAGLIYKISNLSKVAFPISFYFERNIFKLFLLDVGLLSTMSKLPPSILLIGDELFSEFKGALTENYVLTQLITLSNPSIGYYAKERSKIEIDFILQYKDKIFPIEAKAQENVKAKSLKQFITVDKADTGLKGYRFSMKGFKEQDWVVNVPLYAILPFLKNYDSGEPE